MNSSLSTLRQPVIIVPVVVLVIFAAIGLTLVVPLQQLEPRGAAESFEIGSNDSYHVTASITGDGATLLDVELTVTDSGRLSSRVHQDDVITWQYRDGDDAPVYRRYVVPRSVAADMGERLREEQDEEVLNRTSTPKRTTFVTVATDAEPEATARGTVSVVTSELRIARYERKRDSNASGRLAPRAGWYDGRRPYRLQEATGYLRLDRTTGTLETADVQWDRTANTPTYLHYLFNRESTITKRISFEYESTNVTLSTPEWVADVAGQTPGSGGSRGHQETS